MKRPLALSLAVVFALIIVLPSAFTSNQQSSFALMLNSGLRLITSGDGCGFAGVCDKPTAGFGLAFCLIDILLPNLKITIAAINIAIIKSSGLTLVLILFLNNKERSMRGLVIAISSFSAG